MSAGIAMYFLHCLLRPRKTLRQAKHSCHELCCLTSSQPDARRSHAARRPVTFAVRLLRHVPFQRRECAPIISRPELPTTQQAGGAWAPSRPGGSCSVWRSAERRVKTSDFFDPYATSLPGDFPPRPVCLPAFASPEKSPRTGRRAIEWPVRATLPHLMGDSHHVETLLMTAASLVLRPLQTLCQEDQETSDCSPTQTACCILYRSSGPRALCQRGHGRARSLCARIPEAVGVRKRCAIGKMLKLGPKLRSPADEKSHEPPLWPLTVGRLHVPGGWLLTVTAGGRQELNHIALFPFVHPCRMSATAA
ncbi:hypothetical protein Q7P37_004440 [Cladosporium fusiforme]